MRRKKTIPIHTPNTETPEVNTKLRQVVIGGGKTYMEMLEKTFLDTLEKESFFIPSTYFPSNSSTNFKISTPMEWENAPSQDEVKVHPPPPPPSPPSPHIKHSAIKVVFDLADLNITPTQVSDISFCLKQGITKNMQILEWNDRKFTVMPFEIHTYETTILDFFGTLSLMNAKGIIELSKFTTPPNDMRLLNGVNLAQTISQYLSDLGHPRPQEEITHTILKWLVDLKTLTFNRTFSEDGSKVELIYKLKVNGFTSGRPNIPTTTILHKAIYPTQEIPLDREGLDNTWIELPEEVIQLLQGT